jgi:hypothetical protein
MLGVRATVDLCRLWLAAGKRDEARQRLTRALTGCGEGFAGVDLRSARQLLEEIESAPRQSRRAESTRQRHRTG